VSQTGRGLKPGEEAHSDDDRESLEMLEGQVPGSRLTELLRFELEAIESLPTPAI
jgi:hypothetical protein